MTSNPPIDLNKHQKDYSIYLPAISTFYNNYVSKQRVGKYVPDERLPSGFDRGVEGLNFLNDDEGYFSYQYGLYSAGHAQLDLKKAQVQESMILGRDKKKSIIVGDSGGFQIGKGILKFDWHNFEGPEADATRQSILDWLEETADWSMMLDVPGWACNEANSPKTGLKTYEDCLEKTRHNNEFFLKNRQGKTKFLNVLQGTDWARAEQWYEGVKEYSDPAVWGDQAAEGWAMGGANMSRMDVVLKRLIVLREEGLLQNKDWMHFLGAAQLDWSCYLTLIQRQVRKHINPNFTSSFDCASPFVATAHGLVYTKAHHSNKRWTVSMEKAPDNKALSGSEISFPFESEIGRRMVMGDVCHYNEGVRKTDAELGLDAKGKQIKFDLSNPEHYKEIPMMNKIGKIGRTSWDSFSYALLMSHNVYMHIDAVQKANHLMDVEIARVRDSINWRQWKKVKASDKTDEFSDWVPRNILYFDKFVEELFELKTKEEAFALIDSSRAFLDDLEGTRTQDGKARNNFLQLFETDHIVHHKSVSPVFAMPELDDDKLIELEDSQDEL